jgi:hypothetical protein
LQHITKLQREWDNVAHSTLERNTARIPDSVPFVVPLPVPQPVNNAARDTRWE